MYVNMMPMSMLICVQIGRYRLVEPAARVGFLHGTSENYAPIRFQSKQTAKSWTTRNLVKNGLAKSGNKTYSHALVVARAAKNVADDGGCVVHLSATTSRVDDCVSKN
jgi:hypothetical protein